MEKEAKQPLLHISLLGIPMVSFGDDTPVQVPKKVLALLAYIAIEKQAIQRSKLILLFWSDVTDELARNSLRTGLSELKKVLEEYIQPTRQTVSLNWEQPILVDALELETALNKEPMDLENLDKAISLYRGDSLAGLELRDAPEFDDCLLEQQEHYQQIAFEGFDKLIKSAEAKEDYTSALNYAQNMLNLDQLQEGSHYKVIYLYAKQGNRAAAIQQYENCKQTLAETFEIEPSKAIESLIEQIKSGELGQLNKVSEKIGSRLKLPTNLNPPEFLTEEENGARETLFVGRVEELNQLREALNCTDKNKGQVRLVLGSAGQGKSCLLQKFTDQALETKEDLLVLTGYCDQRVRSSYG